MAVAVNDLIDKAEIILQDTGNTRWTAAELINWGSAGQVAIVREVPTAKTSHTAVQLAAGSKQSVPSGAIELIDVFRNMGIDGTTVGDAITYVDKAFMDAFKPDWHSATASTTVKHYLYDLNNPKVFWVYPKSDGTNYVDMVTSINPTALAADGDIDLADEYEIALLDYILFRAYQKDSSHTPQDARILGHYKAFLASLGKVEG